MRDDDGGVLLDADLLAGLDRLAEVAGSSAGWGATEELTGGIDG